ncbi:MAG: hypothetical protein SFU56_22905, partial [Capsulimonadales bacterium]|nr:hypothetical protein [Capsulimonadales bacterium]
GISGTARRFASTEEPDGGRTPRLIVTYGLISAAPEPRTVSLLLAGVAFLGSIGRSFRNRLILR